MSRYLTTLGIGDYAVYQDTDDYAFSQDSVFLASLAKISSNDSVLDLGTGCGILATLAIVKKGAKKAVGIEVQPSVADMAKASVEFNGLSDKINIIEGDVRDVKTLVKAESFDKVLCNPPYFSSGKQVTLKNASRIENKGTLEDFIIAGAYSLRFGADMWIVIKQDRLATLFFLLKKYNLEPKEMTLVYPKLSSGVDVVIVKARKGAKEGLVTSDLIVMDENGNYTDSYKELYV